MSYFPKPSLNENDLAIIERGSTAAHSIDAGQYVSWHGRIGKAKAAILQGATLSDSLFDYDEDGLLNANTNTELISVGSYLRMMKKNGIVYAYLKGRSATDGWVSGGTIPEGYRPIFPDGLPLYLGTRYCTIYITTSGNYEINAFSSDTPQWLSYPVGG